LLPPWRENSTTSLSRGARAATIRSRVNIVPHRAPFAALVVLAALSLAAGCVLDRKGQQPIGADVGRGGTGGDPSDGGGGGRVEGVCGDGVLNIGEVCDGQN